MGAWSTRQCQCLAFNKTGRRRAAVVANSIRETTGSEGSGTGSSGCELRYTLPFSFAVQAYGDGDNVFKVSGALCVGPGIHTKVSASMPPWVGC